ncbi:serine hydrolase domain-containing protein [Leucobacter albus]|uniref:Serine hydrolase domain-containing protein n=1 Tax=Leucobacter albus TaxID=272210 RepID=A0ABW3TRE3_9MICO
MSQPTPAPAAASAPSPAPPQLAPAALGDRLQRELLDGQIGAGEPGAVVAVYRDGVLLASACAGVAELGSGADAGGVFEGVSEGESGASLASTSSAGKPLTPDTLMNTASVSKQLTATAVLLAARAGALDLDADVRGLVPELPVPGVTLRSCLNHTAGLPDYLGVAYTVGIPEIEIAALSAFLGWLETLDALEFTPGDTQSYSNTGYVIAALALERAAGAPFPEVLAESVLRPLGMAQTFSTTVLGEFTDGMAFSFAAGAPGEFVKETMGVGEVEPVRGVNGDGEVITSLNDFGAWQAFLIDGRVLGDDIRQQLLARTVLNSGHETSYGFGIEHETKAHTTGYVHSGGMWSFTAYSIVDEATGLSAACFSNRGGFDAAATAWRAMHIATGFADVAGSWYATGSFSGVRVEVRDDGGLSASGALSDEAETVRWSGGRVWAGGDEFARIEARGAELDIVSWAGISETYGRLDGAAGYPDGLRGAYVDRPFGKTFVFEERDGELWLVPPGRAAEPVRPFGRRSGEWIGETSLGWIVTDGEACDSVRVGLGTFSMELARRADREGPHR